MGPVIFWDFDGTLAFRAKLFASSLWMALDEQHAYAQIGVDDLVPLLKNCLPWHYPDKAHPDIISADEWWEQLYPVLDSALIKCGVNAAQARAFSRESRKHAVNPNYYVIFDDAIPAMKQAAEQGLRQIILSNHVPELPDITMALGLLDYAECCITSACVGYEKPHPQLYQSALAIAGNPRDVWMVGDNLQADVLGAEKCGIKAILVRKPSHVQVVRYSPDLLGAVGIIVNSIHK